MKITMFSNYLNHHQLPLCEAFLRLTGGDFRFVAEDPITQVRLQLGYEDMNHKPFVVRAYEPEGAEEAMRLARESDIIIAGAVDEKYINLRSRLGKPSFKYSERPFKRLRSYLSPVLWRGLHYGEPVYMLCAGAYAAGDFAALGAYKNRCYSWGYFPETVVYDDAEKLIKAKHKNYILWVGRFIKCKRAEQALYAAARLKEAGCDFRLEMLGSGVLRPKMRALAAKLGLEGYVFFPGAHPMDVVRGQMDKNSIFLFTSDRMEGWGAVVNEAMNSGCAVVSSHQAGAAATMIKENENGMLYRFGDIEELVGKLKFLLENPVECERLGAAAYKTITEQWNAKNAAERFIRLAEAILAGEKAPDLFQSGPCSRALKPRSDRHLIKSGSERK